MTSPVGRFIHFMSFQSIMVSVKKGLSLTLKLSLVPAGVVISILTAFSSFSISVLGEALHLPVLFNS